MLPAATVAATTRVKGYKERKRVDVHAHYISPDYLNALHTAGIFTIGGIPIPSWSPESAMEFMDKFGIQIQMLSVSDPGVSFLGESDARNLARSCNEYVAGVVDDNPDRFGALALVPLHSANDAIEEVIYALSELDHDGVGLLSSFQGKYLGDPFYDGLMKELNARKARVFVHPTNVAADDKPSYQIPEFIAEYPFETTRTLISLIFNGVFERYPNIRWHFAHGGGTVPMLRFRLDALATSAAQFGPLLGLPANSSLLDGESVPNALEASAYDTALIADPPSLEAVDGISDDKRLMFGSDWPFASRLYENLTSDPQPTLSSVFGADRRHAIERLNGRLRFPRVRQYVPGR